MNESATYSRLPTEQPNAATKQIDKVSIQKVIELILRQDKEVVPAVAKSKSSLAKSIQLMTEALRKGGRLFFVGAGTSGRLGVLEAAECPPTFNTPPEVIQAIMAGGRGAVFRSQEGAEDNEIEAKKEISKKVRPGDVVIGIAASGITPFVKSALNQARKRKAKTILVTCNPYVGRHDKIDVVIAVDPGPEVISGSTRMKAGTCTKLILNTLTTVSMIQLGKVYEHWMVDLQPKSRKLKARAVRLVTLLGKVGPGRAEQLLKQAHGRAKTAILMARAGLSYGKATERLKKSEGFLRRALIYG